MPNIEVKPIGAESTWLEATWEDRKLLNKKCTSHWRCIFIDLSQVRCYVGKIVKRIQKENAKTWFAAVN